MAKIQLNKLVIIGTGLIGGSFALALRKTGAAGHIVGVGRGRENLELARKMGAIDEIATDIPGALKGADLVLLAMPVGQTGRIMAQMEPHLDPRTVLTDAGSTKQDVLAVAYAYLSGHLANFVPAHPIAGAEQSGVKAANADLYRNKNVVITPLPQTDGRAVKLVTDVWEECGAKVSRMSPEEHDEVLATISHLPHVLAYALMHQVAHSANAEQLLKYAGTGFRDFTRIAGSSPEMWRDICLANRESLLRQMDQYQNQLAKMRDLLANGDSQMLEKIFAHAREARSRMMEYQ